MLESNVNVQDFKSIKWNGKELQKIMELKNNNNLSISQKTILSSIDMLQKEQIAKIRQQILQIQKNDSFDTPFSKPIKNAISYILLKPVSDGCNLHCTYCYEGPVGVRQPLSRMSKESLERIIDEACNQGANRIGFSFHGGEPLLAGLDFFIHAMNIQEKYKPKGIVIENTVQTNGTLIDDSWIEFFEQHNFTVGISFDGIKSIHDKHRIFGNKKGSYDKVLNAIKKIQKTKIPLGIISVITNEHAGYAKEHFDTFSGLNFLDFAVTPSFGLVGDTDVGSVDSGIFSEYVIELFEVWINSGRGDIKIRIIQDAIKGFLGENLTICSLAGTCSKIIAIEPNGDVKSCTRSCGDAEKVFGNIESNTLKDIVGGNVYENFIKNEIAGQMTAKHCQWFEICHNGCSANRTKNNRVDIAGTGRFCDCDALPGHEKGYAGIYRHIRNRIYEILELTA